MSFKSTVEQQWNGNDVKVKGKKCVNLSAFEIGLVVEGQAKLLAAKSTGRLAGSITTQSIENGTDVKSPATSTDKITKPGDDMEVFVGTNVDYAAWVEFGTGPHFPPIEPLKEWARKVLGDEDAAYALAVSIARKGTEAQPFLRPAFDLAQGKQLTIMQKNGRFQFKEYLK